ncbi:MAG TPA: ECF transporter S component [Anaerolineaceae bacterium]|nr:ECF transporter S component [Anaerolineaceae bacterium]HPN52437.1 ECF transporter S component [Anaerolineaceae bacterium]
MLYQIQAEKLDTRMVALLGVLIAINSALRFLETAFPGPAGFTPVFFLIIMVGYIFGGQIGFLMGALTMAVSAVITGGVGPWLPGQMLTAGWVGMSAPLARFFVHMFHGEGKRIEVILLCIGGAFWGLFYGLVINLWFWPLIAGPVEQSWQAGTDAGTTLRHYLTYYVFTSLIWDLAAGAGNTLMIAAFGIPTLRALRRFSQRFSFQKTQPEGIWTGSVGGRGHET